MGLWQHCWSISLPSTLHHEREAILSSITQENIVLGSFVLNKYKNIAAQRQNLTVGWACEGVKTKGCCGTYPLQVVFTKVVSSPGSVLVQREGLRERETGFLPHLLLTPATSDGSRTVKPQRRTPNAHPNGWFCCSLVALPDPPHTLARTGSRRARLTRLSPVCLLFWTDGQTNRTLRMVPRKARWICKLTLMGRDGVSLFFSLFFVFFTSGE